MERPYMISAQIGSRRLTAPQLAYIIDVFMAVRHSDCIDFKNYHQVNRVETPDM